MKELVMQFIYFVAPIVAGFITTILIPIFIKRKTVKYIKYKLDEVTQSKGFNSVNELLDRIEKEILEMRGKRKWK